MKSRGLAGLSVLMGGERYIKAGSRKRLLLQMPPAGSPLLPDHRDPLAVHLPRRMQSVGRDEGRIVGGPARDRSDVGVAGAGLCRFVAIDRVELVDLTRDLRLVAILREGRHAPVGDRYDDHVPRVAAGE